MENSTAVILLNYNNYQATIDCIDRLNKIGICNEAIIVVDNNSANESFEKLKSKADNLHVFKTDKNGGYAYGNNYGIKKAQDLGYQYFCIMNADIYFKHDFLTPLVNYLKEHENVGVIGPCLRFLESGKIASAGGTFRFLTGKSSFDKVHEEYKSYGAINCDYISGGCLITSSSRIEKVGFIPEEYFLDYEDNEWCNNFKKKNFDVVCMSSEYVFHEGESTINTVSGLNLYFMYRNRIIFEKRNADFFQKLVFYPYMVLIIIFSCFSKKRRNSVVPYLDGFTGKNRYSYLIK